jgi:hypothetical protein
MKEIKFAELYPDVLNAVTGGQGINMGTLQCAVGVFPRSVFINQPTEVIIVLQNTTNQTMNVRVSLRFPTEDKQKRKIVLKTPQNVVTAQVKPGEVGILSIPVVANPPTQPIKNIPIHVAVRYRARRGKLVRPFSGGYPPAKLDLSPYKLQALREVQFIQWQWGASTDILKVYFDIAQRQLEAPRERLRTRYEVIWSPDKMPDEQRAARAKVNAARQVANNLRDEKIFAALVKYIATRFKLRGLPLADGEVKMIAKMVGYTILDAAQMDTSFSMEDTHWFQALCHAVAADESLSEEWDEGQLVHDFLLDTALYDAVLHAFTLLAPRIDDDLGNAEERRDYAEKVMAWYGGQEDPDLKYAYFPLILAGVTVNHHVGLNHDNPWYVLDEMRHQYNDLVRTSSGEFSTILALLERELDRAEDELVRSRIQRM